MEEVTNSENPSAEAVNELHANLYASVLVEYRKVVTAIRALPYPPEAFLQALMFLDTGILWAKEAIYHVPFLQQAPVEKTETEVAEKAEVA